MIGDPRIKICGVTRPEDALYIASLDVEYIGLNFWPRSKRYIDVERAQVIAAQMRSAPSVAKLVGVFVDPTIDDVVSRAAHIGLDIIQLHGNEPAALCTAIAQALQRPVWKAVSVASSRDVDGLDSWPVDAILLDAPSAARGGAGIAFDHAVARQARDTYPHIKLVLAGGLDPDNVDHAVRLVRPWCVDVASGVESAPGVKDPTKVAAFVTAARKVDS